MMGIIFSFFSGIYQSLYDSVLGNVLNLLLRFPKSKVHFASVFTALLRPRVWELVLHSAKSTKETLLEICCWQG